MSDSRDIHAPAFRVSVVVPVYNAERSIQQCIDALLAQEYPATHREIILVDNNSTDGTAGVIQANPQVRYVLETERGPAAARNRGAREARHEILVFTDSDCYPAPNWISELLHAFERDADLDVAGGEIIPASFDHFLERKMWERGFLVQQRMLLRQNPFPFCVSANLAIRRNLFLEANGFDTSFPLASGEDMDLGFRIFIQGGRFAYVPSAVLLHSHRTDWRALYRQFVRYGEGSAQFYVKNARLFAPEIVARETTGHWPIMNDVRELTRTAKHYLLRTPGKEKSEDRRWQEILFDYCVRKGFILGKQQFARRTRINIRSEEKYTLPRLTIMLTPCCWREYYIPFTELGKQLQDLGHEVQFLYGHGGTCTFLGSLEGWDAAKCTRQFEYLEKELIQRPGQTALLLDYLQEAHRKEADDFVQANQQIPIMEITWQGFDVWDIIKGSVCRDLKERLTPGPRDTLAAHPVVAKYVHALITAYHAISAYLDQHQPQAVMIFNGFFVQERLLSELAHARGCRVIAHENSCFRDRKIFSATGYVGNWTDPAAEDRFRLKGRALGADQRDHLRAYLEDVYAGRTNTIGQTAPDSEADIRRNLNIPEDSPMVLLIGQVPFDVVMVYDLNVFESMLEFVQKTIDLFRDLPQHTLVVRLHPFEEVIGGDKTWHLLKEAPLPENVRLLHSKDINTYSLMACAQFGIASTSQAALEMASMGKPVVVLGDAFFGRQGFTWDVANYPAYEASIRALCAGENFTPEMRRKMERFLHYLIFEHQIPYDRDAWRFDERSVRKIAAMIGLSDAPQLRWKPGHTYNTRPDSLVFAPAGPEDWTPLDARIAADESAQDIGILAHTGAGAWAGVAVGCAKANVCDGVTLPCTPGQPHVLTVELAVPEGDKNVPIQVHVIDTGGKTLGMEKLEIGPVWKTVTLRVTPGRQITHLGVQIVKRNHPGATPLRVKNFRLMRAFHWEDILRELEPALRAP